MTKKRAWYLPLSDDIVHSLMNARQMIEAEVKRSANDDFSGDPLLFAQVLHGDDPPIDARYEVTKANGCHYRWAAGLYEARTFAQEVNGDIWIEVPVEVSISAFADVRVPEWLHVDAMDAGGGPLSHLQRVQDGDVRDSPTREPAGIEPGSLPRLLMSLTSLRLIGWGGIALFVSSWCLIGAYACITESLPLAMVLVDLGALFITAAVVSFRLSWMCRHYREGPREF